MSVNIKHSDNAVIFTEHASAPATPASGTVALYAKSDGSLYQKDDAGTESKVANSPSVGDVSFKPGLSSSLPYTRASFDWFVAQGLGNWATANATGNKIVDPTTYPDLLQNVATPSLTRARVFRFGSTWGTLPGTLNTTFAQSTTDLATMTNRDIPAAMVDCNISASWMDDVNGYYVAIIWGGMSYIYSTNGTTWNFCPYIYAASATAIPSVISKPAVVNGVYSFYDTIRTKRYYTTDHVTFNQADVANTLGANVSGEMHYVNGLLFCIPPSTTAYYTSADGGITWTARTWPATSASTNTVPLIKHNGTVYLFTTQAAASNTSLYTSTDLVTWNNRTCAFTAAITIQRLAVANNVFFAFSSVSQTKFCTSPDGITWTERTANGASAYGLAVYINSKYMIMSTGRTEGSAALVTWAAETTSGPSALSRDNADMFFQVDTVNSKLVFCSSAGVWNSYSSGSWGAILTTAQVNGAVSKGFGASGTAWQYVVRAKA